MKTKSITYCHNNILSDIKFKPSISIWSAPTGLYELDSKGNIIPTNDDEQTILAEYYKKYNGEGNFFNGVIAALEEAGHGLEMVHLDEIVVMGEKSVEGRYSFEAKKNHGLSDEAISFLWDPTPDAVDISVSYSYNLITGSRITHSTQLIVAHDGLGGAISSSAGTSSDLTSGVSVNIGFYWPKRENRKVMMEDFTQWETNYDVSVPLNEIGIPVDLDLGTTNAQNFYGVSVGGSKPSIAPSLGIRKTFTPYVKPIIKF